MRAASSGMRAERHRAHLRLALPVGVIGVEHHAHVALPLLELEGAGAHGLLPELVPADLLDVSGWHDHQVLELGEGDGIGLVGGDRHGVRIVDMDFLEGGIRRPLAALALGVHGGVEGELDRRRVQLLAIVELDAAAQLELPRRRVHHLPRLRQLAHEVLAVVGQPDQRVEHVDGDVVGRRVVGLRGVEGLDVGFLGNDQIRVPGERRAGGPRAEDRGEGKQDQYQTSTAVGHDGVLSVHRRNLAGRYGARRGSATPSRSSAATIRPHSGPSVTAL